VGFGALSQQPVPWHIHGIVDELRARFLAERPAASEPWSILAISLGGMVALHWAARYPQDFARVVVANTSANVSPFWERFSLKMAAQLPRLLFGDPLSRERTILEATVNSPIDRERVAHEWAGWYRERQPRRRAFVRQIVAASRSTLPAQIAAPVLVLASRADRLVSYRCSERLARAIGARIELHDDAGHDLSLDAPEWICERIKAWQV
jgi:pimeloyl-ACP methyl ester carboxylesterase